MLKPENVWDYPRPAICQPFAGTLKIIVNSVTLAETTRGFRTLETSHPPTYYFPLQDIQLQYLRLNARGSYCEWKGFSRYFDWVLRDKVIRDIGWCYPEPDKKFSDIKDYISFYASKADSCFVNDEQVAAQEGDFYGGWITSNLQGPFKGGADTWGW